MDGVCAECSRESPEASWNDWQPRCELVLLEAALLCIPLLCIPLLCSKSVSAVFMPAWACEGLLCVTYPTCLLSMMLCPAGLLLGLPTLLHGPGAALLGALAYSITQSIVLSATFAVSHNVPESKPLDAGQTQVGPARCQEGCGWLLPAQAGQGGWGLHTCHLLCCFQHVCCDSRCVPHLRVLTPAMLGATCFAVRLAFVLSAISVCCRLHCLCCRTT